MDQLLVNLKLLGWWPEGKPLTKLKDYVRLVSEAYLTGFYHRPRMDKALLAEHAEGLIGLSGCLKGEVAGSLSRGNFAAAKRAFLEYE